VFHSDIGVFIKQEMLVLNNEIWVVILIQNATE